MKQLRNISDLDGKRITQVRMSQFNEKLTLIFDGEYMVITSPAIGDYEGIELDGMLNDTQELEYGIITQSEFNSKQERYKSIHDQRIEKSERQTLERLIEKYGT